MWDELRDSLQDNVKLDRYSFNITSLKELDNLLAFLKENPNKINIKHMECNCAHVPTAVARFANEVLPLIAGIESFTLRSGIKDYELLILLSQLANLQIKNLSVNYDSLGLSWQQFVNHLAFSLNRNSKFNLDLLAIEDPSRQLSLKVLTDYFYSLLESGRDIKFKIQISRKSSQIPYYTNQQPKPSQLYPNSYFNITHEQNLRLKQAKALLAEYVKNHTYRIAKVEQLLKNPTISSIDDLLIELQSTNYSPLANTKKRLDELKKQPKELIQAKALLIDYTKNNSALSRFFHGHWNRTHVPEVNQVVKDIENGTIKDVAGLIVALDDIIAKKPTQGSLAKRIAFIKDYFQSNTDNDPQLENIAHSSNRHKY